MKMLLTAVSALALATPAFAQRTTEAVPPSEAAAPMTAEPAMPAETDTTATPAPVAAAAPAQGPEAVIAAEFASYDKDSSGSLNKVEFTTWMTALKAKSGEPAMKPAELKTWTSISFAQADKDKSKSVSQAELTTYLTAGA